MFARWCGRRGWTLRELGRPGPSVAATYARPSLSERAYACAHGTGTLLDSLHDASAVQHMSKGTPGSGSALRPHVWLQ